jgi:4-amino-4-deoxy-L-arabinose transferase-like glycosyltransferase
MRVRLARTWPDALAIGAIGMVVIVTVASRWPWLGSGEIDWDEGVYWLSMQSMQSGHALFVSVYSSQPPAFLLLTEPPWALLGAGIVAARAVMLWWCAVAVIAGGIVGWRLGGRVAAVAVAVTLAVDPLMVRQSLVLQADGPATSLGVVAVAFAAVAVTTQHKRWGTAAAGLAGAALMVGLLTKLLDIAVIPPLVAVLVSGRGWRRLSLAAFAGALLAGCAILLPLHDAWRPMWNDAVGLHLDTRSASSGISVVSGLRERWQLEALAAAGALVGWRRHPRLVVTGALWVAGATLAMAVTHPLWPHHVVSSSPGFALLGAAGVSTIFAWLKRLPGRRSTLAAAGVTIALVVCATAFLVSGLGALPSVNLTSLATRLASATPASAVVLGDEQYAQALAHRASPPLFVDTSNTRLFAEKGDIQELESTADGSSSVCAVLFSSGRFALLPGFEAWVAHHYPLKLSLGSSRYLYRLPSCG